MKCSTFSQSPEELNVQNLSNITLHRTKLHNEKHIQHFMCAILLSTSMSLYSVNKNVDIYVA